MNAPIQLRPDEVRPGIHLLPSWIPIPGAGLLPVNTFVLDGDEPMLIDTGLLALREDFLRRLREVVDPATLRWIWITHADADHVGNLPAVLEIAPQATVITTFIGLAKMQLTGLTPPRIHLLNPGQTLRAGDRELLAVAPPTFDAPETCGVYDAHSQTLFSADSFGGLLASTVERAADIDAQDLRQGMHTWAMVDAPWLQRIDRQRFVEGLEPLRNLGATALLSSHLPPAFNMTDTLLEVLAQAPDAPPFVGPDQAAFERLFAAA